MSYFISIGKSSAEAALSALDAGVYPQVLTVTETTGGGSVGDKHLAYIFREGGKVEGSRIPPLGFDKAAFRAELLKLISEQS